MTQITVHEVDHDSFQKLKEAFPWLYKSVDVTEWVALRFGDTKIIFFKTYR
jgi:hypothetical protein